MQYQKKKKIMWSPLRDHPLTCSSYIHDVYWYDDIDKLLTMAHVVGVSPVISLTLATRSSSSTGPALTLAIKLKHNAYNS